MPDGSDIFLTGIDSLMSFFAMKNFYALFLYRIMDEKVAQFISHALLSGVTQGRL